MGGGIVLAIIILAAVIGAVAQVIKKQQEAVPPKRPARQRNNNSNAGSRTSQGDIDRFLQEIDRLRKKPADPVPVAPVAKKAKPAPTAKKAKPVQRVDSFPAAPSAPPTVVPVAVPVASAPLIGVTAAGQLTGAAPATRIVRPQATFNRDLLALIADPKAVPMALVLQEILGPPRCRKPPTA